MSSILVAAIVLLGLLATIMTPYAALLAYEWTSYLPPNAISHGPFAQIQFPRITAVVAILAFFALQRDKFAKLGPGVFIIGVYALWVTITTFFFAVGDPHDVMWKYDKAIKTIIMAGFLYLMTDSRARMEAFLSLYALAMSYWILSGAMRTILSGGGGYGSIQAGGKYLISDSSTLVIATILAGVLVAWIGKHSILAPFKDSRIYRWGAFAFIGFCVVLIIGTRSRTGLIAGSLATAFFIFKSKHRIGPIVLAGAAVALVAMFAPPDWFERMATILDAGGEDMDQSAAGRLDSWTWAWNYALEHPFTGGGFRVFYKLHWVEMGGVLRVVDSHSYFFEILAEQGFTGLFIFFSLVGVAGSGLYRLERRTRDVAGYEWAHDLARAMQVGMVALLTGGLFVGIGHFSLMWDFLAVAAALPRVVALERMRAGEPALEAPGRRSAIGAKPASQRPARPNARPARPLRPAE